MSVMITDVEYTSVILELTGKIYNKSYNGFNSIKDDMIQYALLQCWASKNKYDKVKGDVKSFTASIIYNSYNLYIRDNIYKHKDKLTSIDTNISNEEENTTLLEKIGKIDLEYQNIEYIELMNEFDSIIKKRNINKFNKINVEELHLIMNMLMDGYKQKNISKTLNVSSATINRKINLIKDVIKEIKNN